MYARHPPIKSTVKNNGIPAGNSQNQWHNSYVRETFWHHGSPAGQLPANSGNSYKTYMAAIDADGQPPKYYWLLLLRLRYRLLLEMHKSAINKDMDGFQN
jgi:hypothetical protein